MYNPKYKRLQFKLHMSNEKKKFYGRPKEKITILENISQKIYSIIGSCVDKVAKEHFDFIIGGSDCLLSLCQAYILQEKGFRVLIYPFETNEDLIDKLLNEYSELESIKLISYVEKRILKKDFSGDLYDLTLELSKTINKRSKLKKEVLIVSGQKYIIDKDWTSFHDDKPMFILKNNEKVKMPGLWNIPLRNIERFVQNNHVSEGGYLGVSDSCVTTFDHLILNTRPNFNINIDNKKHSVFYFSDAKNNIEKRVKCSTTDRIMDLSNVIKSISKEFSEA